MTEVYLSTIKYPETQELIHKWGYVESGEIRCYISPNNNPGDGFYFYVVERISCIIDNEHPQDHWTPELCMVECIFHGSASFDGIRHLYMGDEATENYGYLYCPDIDTITKALSIIKNLESMLCRDKIKSQSPSPYNNKVENTGF